MPRARPAECLAATDHRPWPLPSGPWVMTQSWHDLLFAHWPVPPAALAPLLRTLPGGLELDLWQGEAWIGVVPFRMSGVRPRWAPALPGLSAFPELNVRTYVRQRGAAGVYFFSLDAANAVAVAVARAWFALPYFRARMRCEARGEALDYRSRRTHRGAPPAELAARYGPSGPPRPAAAGTLEHWLTERYALFVPRGRGLWRGDIHHRPWPLQAAEAEFERDTMARAAGLTLPDRAPLLHFARRLDVCVWAPRRVDVESTPHERR